MLHPMYYKEEVRELDNFGRPDVELKDAEVKVAHQLIEALAGDWEPEKYHDTFEENLKTLIKARLEGEEVTPVEKPKKLAPVVDLMAALKAWRRCPRSRLSASQRPRRRRRPKLWRRRPKARGANPRRSNRMSCGIRAAGSSFDESGSHDCGQSHHCARARTFKWWYTVIASHCYA